MSRVRPDHVIVLIWTSANDQLSHNLTFCKLSNKCANKSEMPRKLVPGDRVIIETRTSEVFEGDVEYVSPQNIELNNIFSRTTNSEYQGNMTFYRNEVVSVRHISNPETPSTTVETNGGFLELSERINMHPDEFDRLREMIYNFVFIDTFGTRFNKAVEILSNRESVAVAGLGNTFVRGKPFSVLVMADFKQVFIFDMFCLVHLKELREVLESEFICKVVHDGTALFDCLHHKYGVEMKNVYDTQIVDSMLSKEDDEDFTRNLSECMTHHFNFPLSILSAAMDDIGHKIWLTRPIGKNDKCKAAQLVAYLLPLRDLLMGKILKKYTDKTIEKYNNYKHLTDIEILKLKCWRQDEQAFFI